MDSNLITPPDILRNGLHSVTLVDPDQAEVDAVIKFCQYTSQPFNVYVYTPNMDNLIWLEQAVDASDAVIVNSRSNNYNHLCLQQKTFYYGPKNFLENPRKLDDPIQYFVANFKSDK